jgi:hypothetical protein
MAASDDTSSEKSRHARAWSAHVERHDGSRGTICIEEKLADALLAAGECEDHDEIERVAVKPAKERVSDGDDREGPGRGLGGNSLVRRRLCRLGLLRLRPIAEGNVQPFVPILGATRAAPIGAPTPTEPNRNRY